MATLEQKQAAETAELEEVKALVRGSRRRGAGGTPGGVATFFLGLALTVVGGYLILNQVQVTSSFSFFGLWGMNRQAGFGLTMLPLLVLVADIIGVFGGYLVSVYKLNFNPASYLKRTMDYLEFMVVVSGLVKAAAFGFLISLMGCFHGYHSAGGAQGVGRATTNAVVSASILILVFNYIITEVFFATR
jgi:ABC-type transporter Mla maintaining outer membrane lipid asymmetry permease subunit MlaE